MEDRATPRRKTTDFLFVVVGWAAVVVSAAALPFDDDGAGSAALFVHMICLPIGFGAVVMVNVYMVQWLRGRFTVRDVRSLASVAHPMMAVGIGGLIASGIALNPDLGATLVRVKLGLLLVIMLNAVRAQQGAGAVAALGPDATGENVPWPVVRRIIGTAILSQAAWWSVIVIGFLVNTSRH